MRETHGIAGWTMVATIIWFISNRLLGKNLTLAKVITTTLIVVSLMYLLLGIISYLVEGSVSL